jgi:hypothetical protein
MEFWLLLTIILFIILFFISRAFLKSSYQLLYLTSGNKNLAVTVVSLFLLPGTIIHELSHMIVAELLRVKTYEFSFIPEIIEKKYIKAGSIQIQKTDPFRHTLIGLSPILFGLMIIFSLTDFFILPFFNQEFITNLNITDSLVLITLLYLLLTIAITMFSSKSDLKASIYPLVFIAVIILALQLAGISININISQNTVNVFSLFFKNLSQGLTITLIISLIGTILNKSIIKIIYFLKRKAL